MKSVDSPEESDTDRLISRVLSMETPLWMRLVQECEEKRDILPALKGCAP